MPADAGYNRLHVIITIVSHSSSYQIDMCQGPLLKKIVLFSMPLMATYVLQLLFNAMDLVVIGRYASHQALAAIGATLSANALIINVLIGMSAGSNVIAAREIGAKNQEKIHQTVSTTMAVALYGGLLFMVIGLIVAKPMLKLLATPTDILPMSCTYLWICFAAIPFIMIYNFGCSLLRAAGDTQHPLWFLIIAGVVNVVLNFVFVRFLGMAVGGVALATAISHGLSAWMIVRALMKEKSDLRLELREIKIYREIFKEMLHIGVPAGISGSLFSVSNMLIQSSINSFGAYAMAGSTACSGIEGIVYVGSYSFHQAVVSFVSQNLGAKQYQRIKYSIWECFACATAVTLLLGYGIYFLAGGPVLRIFNPDPQVVRWGLIRMKILFTTYFLCGLMDVANGALRGLGYPIIPTIYNLIGACLFRIWWVLVIFPKDRSFERLFLTYPLSWIIVTVMSTLHVIFAYRHILRTGSCRAVCCSPTGPGVFRGFRVLGKPK